MTENDKPKPRYFYPYCGHRLGFCLSGCGCLNRDKDSCQFYSSGHPFTGRKPQMVTGIRGNRLMFKTFIGGDNAKAKAMDTKA